MESKVEGWTNFECRERLTKVLDKAYTDGAVGRMEENLWKKHCLHCTPHSRQATISWASGISDFMNSALN